MRICFKFICFFLLMNYSAFGQIYGIVNSQLFLKSKYKPEKFYLEKVEIPINMHLSRELAFPDSQKVLIYILNSKRDTVKIIHNDWLEKGLYDVRWNGTNKLGEDIGDGSYQLFVNIKYPQFSFVDSSSIFLFGNKYYRPLSLSNKYLFEYEKIIRGYKYSGSGLIEKNISTELKNYVINFAKVEIDTLANSMITLEGRIHEIESRFTGIPYFEIIVTQDNINFECGKLGLADATISSWNGNFSIKDIVFPNTKIFFLHKDYLIKCFDIGDLSYLYKDNPEMLKRYQDKN